METYTIRDLRRRRFMTQTELGQALGVKTEVRLSGSYERREYNVQLRESDFSFVERLMEDEGIFYFFLEGDVMVLGDSAASYETGGPVLPFRAGSGLEAGRGGERQRRGTGSGDGWGRDRSGGSAGEAGR